MKNLLNKLYSILYYIIPNRETELEKAIGNSKTVLDVGCGESSPIQPFSKNFYSAGVDIFKPSLEKSKKKKIHNKYYQMNVLEIGKKFKPGSFDCVLSSDVIEHFKKSEGLKLLSMMERIAKHKVVLFTPNGFLPQHAYDNNPWQIHKSGWSAKEMKKRGYRVIGINGIKSLRKELAAIRYKPSFLWLLISDISQFFVRNRPEKAFQILCIKTK